MKPGVRDIVGSPTGDHFHSAISKDRSLQKIGIADTCAISRIDFFGKFVKFQAGQYFHGDGFMIGCYQNLGGLQRVRCQAKAHLMSSFTT